MTGSWVKLPSGENGTNVTEGQGSLKVRGMVLVNFPFYLVPATPKKEKNKTNRSGLNSMATNEVENQVGAGRNFDAL